MATSGEYTFLTPESVELITDAYERVITLPDVITAQQIQTAQRSINLALSSWYNRGWNLWTTGRRMLGLYPGQNTYTLPIQVQDILWAELRESKRLLGGTAFSTPGGTAFFAFDNNPLTSCNVGAANGTIGYSWGSTQYAVQMVGVQSATTTTYSLTFEFSNDGITWTVVDVLTPQVFTQGILEWFIITSPTLGSYFRIRETAGATLNIQELFFNNDLLDTNITPLSAKEYDNQPNKNAQGKPSSYYLNRQITPVISLWLTPSPFYNALFYTTQEAIQDIGQMTNSAQVPTRFLEALTAELAYRLSVKLQMKFNIGMDKVQFLKSVAEQEFTKAAEYDTENVPTRIYPDTTGSWFR